MFVDVGPMMIQCIQPVLRTLLRAPNPKYLARALLLRGGLVRARCGVDGCGGVVHGAFGKETDGCPRGGAERCAVGDI